MSKQLNELIPLVFDAKHSWKIQLLQQWSTIFGSLSQCVQIEKIERETLVLGVTNSCWLQEFSVLSPLLLRTINEKLADAPIKQLRFKLSGTKRIAQKTVVQPKKQQSPSPRTLNAAEQAALEQIKDNELRAALQQFLIRCAHE